MTVECDILFHARLHWVCVLPPLYQGGGVALSYIHPDPLPEGEGKGQGEGGTRRTNPTSNCREVHSLADETFGCEPFIRSCLRLCRRSLTSRRNCVRTAALDNKSGSLESVR